MILAVPPFVLTHTARQLATVVRRDEADGVWRCRYCRVDVVQLDRPWTEDGRPFPERDHVVPRSRGGSNSIDNISLACAGCNVRKGSKLLSELPQGWHDWRNTLVVTPAWSVEVF
jgi:5-methylcytosine-specific restriction endonuclease McrA